MSHIRSSVAFLGALALLWPAASSAQSTTDMIEHLFGSSNVNAIAGNGGLTIAASPLGDLAVLTSPSPSYTDQLLHIASNDLEVRAAPLMTSHPAMGAALEALFSPPSVADALDPGRSRTAATA